MAPIGYQCRTMPNRETTMRAMISEKAGGPESLVLKELPSAPVGKGQVRVAVHAAGVNFPDTLIIADKYQFKPPRPFAPGHEVGGVVVEVGEGVTAYKPGDRVIGMIGHGGYADETVIDQANLLPMPENMSFEEGAAFTMTYGTSYYALKQRAGLKQGETLLVLGAAGGVGLTAVELGALMGAKVIAAVGSDEKMEICRKYGATMFVNYTKEKLRDKVKELTGGNGADVIYDPVGGDAFDEAIRCIAWYGRLLVIGFASGRIPSLPANLALLKSCDVRGVFYGAWRGREPAEARKNFDEMFAWVRQGKLKPHISMRFPLEKAPEAMNALLSRKATGKVVITTR
jgi:NADPH2:quinone reductase